LTGVIGTETVTLAGVKVTGQTIALVTAAAWEGDGTVSSHPYLNAIEEESIFHALVFNQENLRKQ
jgi:hypothetical protein